MTNYNTAYARQLSLENFLKKVGWRDASYSFLAGDASFRKYYRVSNSTHQAVLMDAPSPENPQQFCRVSNLLCAHNFSAPRIIATDFSDGFVLLEDLGDLTYTKVLKNDASYEEKLYELAVDTLITLHKSIRYCEDFISPYSSFTLLQEATLFLDWYWPQIKGKEISSVLREEYQQLWTDAFKKCDGPKSLVLRDYHVDNLMLLKDRSAVQSCGILDFQDAVWGSVTYDLVSLLEDARRDVPFNLRQSLWNRYLSAFPSYNAETLKTEGCILSAGRHTKILGVFKRLAIRDGKTAYLIHIPRIWRWLEDCLKHPSLQPLQYWFDEHFSPSERIASTCV